ncbi:MAG: hypothetical protein GY832_00520, partial [Chloroflexi bacterium]|nr:hypothetical protein [Chloroflexota bacterium]
TDTAVRTLILFNGARMNQFYTGTGTAALTRLVSKLHDLNDNVDGKLVALDDYPRIVRAYEQWDKHPDSPQHANHVAMHIKSLLYSLTPAYPNLEYLVIVGDDRVIPHRRIHDEALVANERNYAETAFALNLNKSLERRYFLSDDYYAGLLPLPWRGRELYLPQIGIGRLVEKPSEIVTAIDAFLAQPVIMPSDALVTGYDFLIDQADAISATLASQGIAPVGLINDTWTDDDFRTSVFISPDAYDLNSLNSHFQHYSLYPTNPLNEVFATEVTATTNYSGSLVFSVGCHSGLNVPDGDALSAQTGTDWAQAFLRQGATFIGNTGYGYGDSDLIAYSERLMTNFVDELGYWKDGHAPTVGQALLSAKQRYYNSASGGSLSNYDEKVMGIMAIYGLPMLEVRMPITTTPVSSVGRQLAVSSQQAKEGVTVSSVDLSFTYTPHTIGVGTYYVAVGEDDVHVAGALPIQPRASRNVHEPDTIAHGALLVGGTFSDTHDFDPVISRPATDELTSETEFAYPVGAWYPAHIGTVNRFLSIDGQSHDQLVVVPAQFRATSNATPTVGTQRLYSDLKFEIYHAPLTATDFIAPSVWQVEAISSSLSLTFRVLVQDDSGSVARTVVLYREQGDTSWSRAELAFDGDSGLAQASVSPVSSAVYYFVQAVDPSGNVALVLDHENPFV